MGKSIAKENRLIRQQAFKERMSVEVHYREFVSGLERLAQLAESDSESDDRKFAKWLKVAEKHWAVCAAYMPKPKDDEPLEQTISESLPRGGQIAERLLGRRIKGNNQGTMSDGSLVPTPIRPEKE